MKTKLIVNGALSVLVALGVAACSSGGGSSSPSEIRNSAGKARQEARQQTDRVQEGINTPSTEIREETRKSAIPLSYRHNTASNANLGEGTLDALIKKVDFSESGELIIDGKRSVNKIAVTDKLKLIDFINNKTHQWNYQTFGRFDFIENDISGFVSVGNKTEASAIPTANTATYTGLVWAKSLASDRALRGEWVANLSVDVDFATKDVVFKTENSVLNRKQADTFNLSGTAKLDSAKNEFIDGKIHFTHSPDHKGTLEGALYGPKAEEVGGTFNIENGQFIGGFGGKR